MTRHTITSITLVLFAVVILSSELRAGTARYRNETQAEYKHRMEKERRHNLADQKRAKAKAEQAKREAEQEAKAKATRKRLADKEAELNNARLAGAAQRLKAEASGKTDFVTRPKGVKEVTLTWTGTLSKKAMNVTGKEEPTYTLTTSDGKCVVFTKKAMVEYSLSGIDLALYIGKEITVKGSAYARHAGDKLLYHVVSKINSSTLKSSAIYDDLAE